MKLIEVKNKKEWDAFAERLPHAQFTQSWNWGEFQNSRGRDTRRLALSSDSGITAAGQFIFYKKPLVGGFWYAPRGPISASSKDAAVFLETLTKDDLPGRSFFTRVEPPFPVSDSDAVVPKTYVQSHAYMPATTLILDLTPSEENLLKNMHEKTRYNIRLAERKGVVVREGQPKDIEIFLKLNQETASRDAFTSQPAEYIRVTYEFLQEKQMAQLRIAERNEIPLAASIEITFGDTVTYLYGASSSQNRNVMAPFALHWDAIKSAKNRGAKFYDFHGINPVDSSSPYFKESWAGITRFKLGFGGERFEYVGTWEKPTSPMLHRLYRMFVN